MKRLVLILLLIGTAIATTAAYHLLKSEWVLYRQAEGYFVQQGYDRAAILYREALDAGLVKPDLYPRLAYSLLMSGRPQEAIALYKRVFREQPGRLADITAIADALSRMGRFDEALELYLSAVGRHPDVRFLRIHLARMFVQAGRFDEAVSTYKQFLGESP
ncbi:MAG: tetratricopeptide repeat protein [bacterium]